MKKITITLLISTLLLACKEKKKVIEFGPSVSAWRNGNVLILPAETYTHISIGDDTIFLELESGVLDTIISVSASYSSYSDSLVITKSLKGVAIQ